MYHLAKRGGNKKLTQIKKVQGDGQALRRDLAQFLGLDVKEVRVKVPTGHVEVDVSTTAASIFVEICEGEGGDRKRIRGEK